MRQLNVKQKILFSIILGLFCSIASFAQSAYEVIGVVTAEDGLPLPGVNVLVPGTANGAATDFDGNYAISVANGDSLEFTYIGFATQTIAITGQKTINVTLKADATSLDEVVIVGYGTRKKSHSTGSIAKIGGDDVTSVQTARVDDALAGKLAGVRIQNTSGEPGGDPVIQVRSSASISSDLGPLIVVDGFPISGSLASINPNDIESLEVLKDAASAAIYGSRGAAGVILVTTKKGKSGKTKFSYNAYTSISEKYEQDNLILNAGEWADRIEENIANGTWDVSEGTINDSDGNLIIGGQDLADYRINAFRNSPGAISPEEWLFKRGTSTSHDFSARGGTDDLRFFASVGYLDTEGIALTQEYQRYNARLSVDANLSKKFKTGLSFNGSFSDRAILAHDQRDLLRAAGIHPIYHTEESIAFVQDLNDQAVALGLDPFDNGYRGGDAPFNNSIQTLQVGDTAQDWHYGRSGNGIGASGDAGPATKLDNQSNTVRTYTANVNAYLQYEFIDGLNLKTTFGADIEDTSNLVFAGLEFDSRARTNQTNLDQTDLKETALVSVTTVDYSKVIGKHDIAAVAGFEVQNTFFRGIRTNATNVPFGDIINFALIAPEDIAVTQRIENETRQSVFGRINYAFDDRYLASVSLRRDGDSRFGEDEQYATFPAVSLGWNVHNESFYNSDILSLLKLRFSVGTLGTSSFLGAYQSIASQNLGQSIFGISNEIPTDIANPNLTWQENTETNYGVDLGFLNNRIKIGADYYTSDIEDILLQQSVSEQNGISQQVLNVGDLESSGFEVEISASIIQNENFKWNVSGNFSTVETEITDLGNLDELPRQIYGQSGRGPVFRNYVGGEIGEMWGLQSEGLVEEIHIEDPTRTLGADSGEVYVTDQLTIDTDGDGVADAGDGIIDNTRTVEEGGDLVKIGQNTPDFYWGFNSNMTYKNFDMSFQLQGSHGAEVFNIDPLYWQSQFGGRLRDTFDANGDNIADASGRTFARARDQTSSAIQDASFVALRNLTVGYTLPVDTINSIGLESVRLYVASTNLLYLTADGYTSFNPEGIETTNSGYAGPTTNGVQVGASPVVRSFTFGLNLNF